jgi:hypothetical protein
MTALRMTQRHRTARPPEGKLAPNADYFRLPTETAVFGGCVQMLRFCAASARWRVLIAA